MRSWKCIAACLRSSYRRAFSILTLATLASAVRMASSSSVNGAPSPLSARYRLPYALPRTTSGTPSKVVIIGWPTGKPTERGSAPTSATRMGLRSASSPTSRPCPCGSPDSASIRSSSTPTVIRSTNSPSEPSTPSAPYRVPTRSVAASTMCRSTARRSMSSLMATTASRSLRSRRWPRASCRTCVLSSSGAAPSGERPSASSARARRPAAAFGRCGSSGMTSTSGHVGSRHPLSILSGMAAPRRGRAPCGRALAAAAGPGVRRSSGTGRSQGRSLFRRDPGGGNLGALPWERSQIGIMKVHCSRRRVKGTNTPSWCD
ncbi:hypothetical protein STEPF1_01470 [Streptomyces sp. F-1]|nr:hypothetical protein STEPF1_01470 [Streptomyces sp. F-1]